MIDDRLDLLVKEDLQFVYKFRKLLPRLSVTHVFKNIFVARYLSLFYKVTCRGSPWNNEPWNHKTVVHRDLCLTRTQGKVDTHPVREPSLFGDDPVSSAAHVDMKFACVQMNEYHCCSLCSSSFIVSPSVISLRMLSTGLPLEASRMFAHVEISATVAISFIVVNSSVYDASIQVMLLLPFLHTLSTTCLRAQLALFQPYHHGNSSGARGWVWGYAFPQKSCRSALFRNIGGNIEGYERLPEFRLGLNQVVIALVYSWKQPLVGRNGVSPKIGAGKLQIVQRSSGDRSIQ